MFKVSKYDSAELLGSYKHSGSHSSSSLRKFSRMKKTVLSATLSVLLTSPLVLHADSFSQADPAAPTQMDISAASIQVALSRGKLNSLIAMISQCEQKLTDLEARVEGDRQKVNLAMAKASAAQESSRIAEVSMKSATAEQTRAEKEAQKAKAELDALIKQAYMNGVSPNTMNLLLTSSDNDSSIVDQTSVIQALVRQAKSKYRKVMRLNNIAANSSSLSAASKMQAHIALTHATMERKQAQKLMASSISAVNKARDERRELLLKKSLAQAAYDAANSHLQDVNTRVQAYELFKRKLAQRLVSESGMKVSRGTPVRVTGKQTPTVSVLTKIFPLTIDVPELQAINSIPIVKDLPGMGLLTGSKSIDPAGLAFDSIKAFVGSATKSGDPITNVIGGTIHAVEIPFNGISQALGLEKLGIPGLGTRYVPTEQNPFLHGEEAIEAVIARGMAVLGTPYAWGGGSFNGPTKGIRDGGVADAHGDYNKVGFDCSGLMMYAFAAAGIHLPHYTGYQYNSGPKVPLSSRKRGDMIFYGPGASQHVALILGDGTMLEAPESGSNVKISPERTGGAMPMVVRMF